MGVMGCGKSSVGRALAERLQCRFIDADDYHPPANREKLSCNIPLGDEDRWPWLRLLADLLSREAAGGVSVVLACSALKEAYREVLRSCGYPVAFVHLAFPRVQIAARLCLRAGQHDLVRNFDRILDGQFRDLEPPSDAIVVNVEETVEAQADAICAALLAKCAQGTTPT